MIEVEDLSFKYVGRKRPALRNVSFHVAAGESLLILGPSGCGKSTLGLCLNGAIPHFVEGDLTGHVRVGGRDTREVSMAVLAQRVGVVFQDPEAQFCMLTVEEEVAFGLENLAVPRYEMDALIDEALAWVGLSDRRRERIERLSGGQKQRLALACVLAQRPEVLVFDEPTAQLDPSGAAEVVDLLGRLRDQGRHTLIVVEHRLDEIMHLIDRVLVLGPTGEVVALGPPHQVMRDHGDWLANSGVWVPQVTEVASALQRQGLPLTPFPLTVAEATEALRPLVRARQLDSGRRGIPSSGASEPAERKTARVGFSPEPVIEVRGLTHQFPGAARPTFRDVSFTLSAGEFVAIAGPNGAGKSTLARLLVRILTPPPQTVYLNGKDLRALAASTVARQVGYVFQYPEHQFVGATLLDDVAFGLRQSGLREAEALHRAQAMLDDFGLGRLGPAHPFSLSHGEQRRLSVAAMLVLGQSVLLLDEPSFGQDRRNAAMLFDKLSELVGAGRAIVTITHDMRLVAERADRVLVVGEGHLLCDDRPSALFADPVLLQRANLKPPPLWELSRRLGFPSPVVRVSDFVAQFRTGEVAVEGSNAR